MLTNEQIIILTLLKTYVDLNGYTLKDLFKEHEQLNKLIKNDQ